MASERGEWGDAAQTWRDALERILKFPIGQTHPSHLDDGFREAWYLAQRIRECPNCCPTIQPAPEGKP